MEEKIYAVWLATLRGIGDLTIKRLVDKYETAKNIYELTPEEIDLIDELNKNQRLVLKNKNLDYAWSVIRKCEEKEIDIICFNDENFPDMLRYIPDPPYVLYKKGINIDFNNTAFAAIVGARHASVYGVRCAEDYAYELSRSNIVIVSGMAYGVDAGAHRGALKAGLPTVAVLGSGVDICYPLENKELYDYISKYGVLLSEYPPETPVFHGNFPKRNRIISAISHVVIVTEASIKSGSLKTANFANEYGRMVFAVPNSITNRAAAGSNELIKDYAALTTTPNDIVTYMYGRYGVGVEIHEENNQNEIENNRIVDNLSPEETKILSVLSEIPKHIDRIVREVDIPTGRVNANLTLLEMKNLIVAMPGNSYSKNAKLL